jgi:hypothetical protein
MKVAIRLLRSKEYSSTDTLEKGIVMIRNRIVLLVAFFFPLLMQAQSSKPIWDIDLAQIGYQGRPPERAGPTGTGRPSLEGTRIGSGPTCP